MPQSDGLVERANQTIKQMLKSAIASSPRDWDEYLPYVMKAYRSSVHSSTNCNPNKQMFGRENRLPVLFLYGSVIWFSSR